MLSQQRKKIDAIDRQMVALFEERMEVVKEVIAVKKANGLPILDQGREDKVIAKVQSYLTNPEFAPDMEKLYATILTLSRAYQEQMK